MARRRKKRGGKRRSKVKLRTRRYVTKSRVKKKSKGKKGKK
tara:strand:+ start:1243 stop:1365 length:123 start_codon:yes stop_codon:yes gene_type:complete